MNFEYEITFLKCQSCTAKIHCEQCAQELRERMLLRGADAHFDIPSRTAAIRTSMDEDGLLDLLEELGVFAD